jgi:hypothetical protein
MFGNVRASLHFFERCVKCLKTNIDSATTSLRPARGTICRFWAPAIVAKSTASATAHSASLPRL